MLDVSQVPQRDPVTTWLDSPMVEAASTCPFAKRGDYVRIPLEVSLCFTSAIARQDHPDPVRAAPLKCGTMRITGRRRLRYYEVNNFTAIVENVIPFFDRFGSLSKKKQRDFLRSSS